MGARLIDKDSKVVKKVMANSSGAISVCKKQYERVNGVLEPTYYDGYVLYNELKSDGNAYIDLGHKGDSTHKYEIDFEYKLESADTSVLKYLFGARSGFQQNEISIPKGATSTSEAVMQNGASNGVRKTFTLLSTNSRYKISISRSEINVNINGSVSTQANTVTTDFTTAYNLLAFAMNENGSTNITNVTFHSIKEYDANGKLLYHYVPARRQSDNVLGLLDVVNGVFYINANSTGYFLVGDSIRGTASASSTFTLNLNNVNTSITSDSNGNWILPIDKQLTTMNNFAFNNTTITFLDSSLVNYSKINSFVLAFKGTSNLTSVTFGAKPITGVSSVSSMFDSAKAKANMRNFEFSSPVSMTTMFGAYKNPKIGYDDSDDVIFPNITIYPSSIGGMFQYMYGTLAKADIRTFNFAKCTDVSRAFYNCMNSSLNIYLGSGALNLSPTTTYTGIFYGVSTSAKLKVPTGTLASFQAHTIWSTFPGTIEEY